MNIEIIIPAALKVGMNVTAHWKQPYGCGTGGRIVVLDLPRRVTLLSGTAQIVNDIDPFEVDHWTIEVPYDAEECLDYHPDHCDGPVDMWYPGSGHRSWPRCTFHGEQRLARSENSMERYADSDVVPSWFDPADAGEHWGDDY